MTKKIWAFLLAFALLTSWAPFAMASELEAESAPMETENEAAESDQEQFADAEDPENAQLNEAVALYEAGEYEEALGKFLTLAEAGNATAMAWTGFLYEQGLGTEKSVDEAMRWFTQAAELGDGYSMQYIGRLYYFGKLNDAGEADYAQALEWTQQAYDSGHVDAEMLEAVGLMYFFGNGTQTDYDQAEYWLTLAAELDRTEAMHRLGEIYDSHREDVEDHNAIARQWYERGAELDDASCKYHLACYMIDEATSEEEINRGMELCLEVAEAGNVPAMGKLAQLAMENGQYETAYAWLRKGEESGSEYSYIYDSLGFLYASGHVNGEADYEQAAHYYEHAAELGSGYALYQIGIMYQEGQHYEKSEEKAQEYFLMAEEAGYAQSAEKLAQIAMEKQDYETAYTWFSEAEEAGSEYSYVYDSLGFLYASGYVNGEADYEQAAHYYEHAAELGSGYALYQIGIMYQEGQHYEKSEEKAQKYFLMAEEAGYIE